ncbi:MAG: zinc ribbon domain-containing protein [Actinomycetota bacterium]|nr:zinc ribbon domain-containing protein [Actinomycetota bacterium]MDQ3642178.1 zinc ribbon domain-containing protein [Actinomycetota bacterium]
MFFRDTWHPAPHSPLVSADVFAKVQSLLAERGEDHSRRAADASDYLLAGLIVCGLCGKRFVGTAASGNRFGYKYYTCFSASGTAPTPARPSGSVEEQHEAELAKFEADYERPKRRLSATCVPSKNWRFRRIYVSVERSLSHWPTTARSRRQPRRNLGRRGPRSAGS